MYVIYICICVDDLVGGDAQVDALALQEHVHHVDAREDQLVAPQVVALLEQHLI